jgi:cystathionine beta-lyase/cystathionine gamma-synthase
VAEGAAGSARSDLSGDAGSRGHELWKRDFIGASGLFRIVLQPVAKARIDAMLDSMQLFGMGWSWGGFESLIIPIYPERVQTATKWNPVDRACGWRSGSRIPTT